MAKKKRKIKVEVIYTPGYEQRFTEGILKIFENRERQKQAAKEVS